MIQCNICGHSCKKLTPHIKSAHNMTKQEYLDKYPGAPLLDESLRKKFQKNGSNQSYRNWQNKEFKERTIKRISEDPEFKMTSDRMKSIWERDSYRENHVSPFKELWKDEEFRQKVSDTRSSCMNAMWKDPVYQKKMSDRFKELWEDEDFRNSQAVLKSNRLKVYWEDPEYKAKMSCISTRTLASQGRLSYPHLLVSDYLDSIGVNHENEYILGSKSFDIYLPEQSVAIEVNGEYWHGYHDISLESMTKEQVSGYYRDMKRIDLLGRENILFLYVKRDIMTGAYKEIIKSYLDIHNVSYIEG